MNTYKLGEVEYLDDDEAAFFYEDVVVCLDKDVVKLLDKNNKDDFNVDFILANHLELLLEKALGRKCLVYHG